MALSYRLEVAVLFRYSRDSVSGKNNTPPKEASKPSHLVGPQKYRRLRTIPPVIAFSQLPTFATPEGI